MRVTAAVLALTLIAAPALASHGGGGHRGLFGHGLFGGGHRGHSINAWMGSRRPRLR